MQDLTSKIFEEKLKLTTKLKQAESIRDFGGMWKVNGMYLTDGAYQLHCKFASMVDKLKTPEYDLAVEKLQVKDGIQFEYIDTDFRELATYQCTRKMQKTEVSLLNDVLLHQNNFTEVIKQVCQLTTGYIIVNQPFYEGFEIPSSCTLLQFMSPEWKKKLYNIMWVDQRELNEYSVDIWMWAQSLQLMIDIFKGYGWKPKQDCSYTFPIENNWHYTGIIFEKA